MWGWQCKSSTTAKENCALRCLSPICYEIIYESDPLEEGEKDLVRGQEFKYCLHKERRKDIDKVLLTKRIMPLFCGVSFCYFHLEFRRYMSYPCETRISTCVLVLHSSFDADKPCDAFGSLL
ncbi:hypothetical protein TIFTF001_017724 [Ficus carica]|uniref:Uncharacterized protein n=1 Tax=Ficus carica TaxID=3494 RepID=A0AA88D790_FICCA|nr:hypothetical protein TIFTF001_017724 [Ficus carica]